jgi:hypothetical protein
LSQEVIWFLIEEIVSQIVIRFLIDEISFFQRKFF